MSNLIRITRGPWEGCTGRIVNMSADTIRVRLTTDERLVRIPREDSWYEDVDPQPMTANEARERMASR